MCLFAYIVDQKPTKTEAVSYKKHQNRKKAKPLFSQLKPTDTEIELANQNLKGLLYTFPVGIYTLAKSCETITFVTM